MDQATRDQRLQRTLLQLVAVARGDERMKHSVGEDKWHKALDTIEIGITRPKAGRNSDAIEFLKTMRDSDISAQMQRLVLDFSDSSPLAGVRKHLGITSADQEKPFKIIVSNVQHEPGNDQASNDRFNSWKVITDFEPKLKNVAALVVMDHGSGLTMFLPHDTATELLSVKGEAPQSEKAEAALFALAHEYVHTQVQLSLARGPGFGQLFDEVFADHNHGVQGGDFSFRGYNKDLAFLKVAGMLAGIDIPREINAMQTHPDTSDFYSFLGQHMGASHALLLSAMQPAERGKQSTELVPLSGIDPEHVRAKFLDTLVLSQIEMHNKINGRGSAMVKDRIDREVKRLVAIDPQTSPAVQLEDVGVPTGAVLSGLLDQSARQMTQTIGQTHGKSQGLSTL